MEKLHYERMDGESKTAQKRNFIKRNLAMSKSTSLLVPVRETNLRLNWKPKPIPKSKKRVFVQVAQDFLGIERPRLNGR